MATNMVLENATTARFAIQIDRYFEQGKGEAGLFGLQFAYDRPKDDWNAAGIKTQVVGLMTLSAANTMRSIMFPYYRAFDFADLDKTTADFITYSMAPMEWHGPLARRDAEYMSHLVIWAEQMPVIPPPPSAGEVLVTGLLSVFLGGMLSGAEKVQPKDDKVLAENIKAFVKMSQETLPTGTAHWDLDSRLTTLNRYIRTNEITKAVFLIRVMSFSSDEVISHWATRAMSSCGIPK